MMKVMKRFGCDNNRCIQKPTWEKILNMLPDSKETSRIYDAVPKDMTKQEFKDNLTRTLVVPWVYKANPLITSPNAQFLLDSTYVISYGKNDYTTKLSIVVKPYQPIKKELSSEYVEYSCFNRGDIFFGIHCNIRLQNMEESIWINDIEVKLKEALKVYPDRDTQSVRYGKQDVLMVAFNFFPSLGPIVTKCEGLTKIRTKKSFVINNFAFGMCSAGLKMFLKK